MEKEKSNWYTLCQLRLKIYIKENFSTEKEVMHHILAEGTVYT